MSSIIEEFRKAGYEGVEIEPPSREFNVGPRNARITVQAEYTSGAEPLQAPPSLSQLPPHYREFIDSIRNTEPLGEPSYEKMKQIHDFTLENMTYIAQYGDIPISLKDIIEDGNIGDCDDYASHNMALMRLADFPPESMDMVTAMYDYTDSDGASLGALPHAAVTVGLNGQTYLLDMNMQDPAPLENMTASGQLSSEGESPYAGQTINVSISDPAAVVNGQADNNPVIYFESEMLNPESTTSPQGPGGI